MTENQFSSRPIILCFIDYYLPGYRSGGPVRSISNFVDYFGDEFDIRIVTRDRDALDANPYHDVLVDDWNQVGKSSVFYASRGSLSFFSIAKLLRNTRFDILYLNSFFSYRFTALPLLARKLLLLSKVDCVIAPRGEFSRGAMALKFKMKSLYLILAKLFRLFSRLSWQASSDFELADIQRLMGTRNSSIKVAPDLPAMEFLSTNCDFIESCTNSDLPLRLVYLSRITPMKNLVFLLESLRLVREEINLSIYGPLEDLVYWKRCQSLITILPSNVSVEYLGEVNPSSVMEVFSAFELFVLPTFGENYGHVVLECLTSGTPVLISDQTPWSPSADGAVLVLSLVDCASWAAALDRHAQMNADEKLKMKLFAMNYAREYRQESNVVEQTRNLFYPLLR